MAVGKDLFREDVHAVMRFMQAMQEVWLLAAMHIGLEHIDLVSLGHEQPCGRLTPWRTLSVLRADLHVCTVSDRLYVWVQRL